MPFGQVGVDKRLQRLFLGKDLGAQAIDLIACLLQGFLDQFVLDLKCE